MYLKSIEIHGFKSFANKIKFEFPNGITGIVGPNGSGKSNVADAVRWVFGEQKIKQLRGNKMEDVIFAGTANRKPQAFAFVSITLDNSDRKLKLDYSEVTVSRRIYRSGESEYMINGSVCRLKDVQELFYDTGIGKEGYSIIGQGQIDKILQGKPEERRELFDEAAGIVKYKKRKTIALRKLENERLNLTRIQDITTELGKQVGPLKRQSEAADKFLKYRDELKRYDVNLFLVENGDVQDRIEESLKRERIAADEMADYERKLEAMKEEFEQLNADMILLDEQIEQTKNNISRCDIAKETFIGQINVLNEQIRSAENSKGIYAEREEALMGAINRANAENERLEAEKAKNQDLLTKAISDSDAFDSELLELQNKIEEARLQINSSKERLVELVSERGRISSQIERLETMSEQMARRREEITENLARFESDKAAQAEKISNLQQEFETAKQETIDTIDRINEIQSKIDEAAAQVQALEKESSRIREQSIRAKTSLDAVKNITERYEGYGNSIKEVMKLKNNYPGIYGVVADIIKVEKKYEVAIETALGGSIQNVVTDTETTAKQIIEYLKKNRLGRATFLPIKAIVSRGEFKNVAALDEPGVIGLASTLVDVDSQFKEVAEYLLGRTVVADNIDNAIRLARKYRYTLMIVTLDGELLSRGGSLTGGAFKNKSNLLGRRREIEELENSIKKYETDEKDITARIETAADERRNLTVEQEVLKGELQEQKLLLNTIQINLEQANSRMSELDSGFQGINSESSRILEEADQVAEQNSSLKDELDSNASENEKLKAEIDRLEVEREELKSYEGELLIRNQNKKNEKSEYITQNSYLTNSIIKNEAEITRLTGDLEKLRLDIQKNNEGGSDKAAEIEQIQAAIEGAEQEGAQAKEKLVLLEADKEKLTSSNKEFVEKRQEYSDNIANLDKEIFRLSGNREKMEERFETRSAYIWEEYELTFTAAGELRDETLNDVKEMKEKISSIKSSIRGLGTINVSAIEEYKEVSERYEFLKGQYDDVKKAEEDLVKIIRDLDNEMRKQFKTEFAKIQEEFGKVFKEMFGGGHGEIILEEDVDILDAGITIIAQPPGKKLQNMMQLSGGEKALTAIAILFAIQNLKPSPFCLLDEIEAALDDSNIGRFAGYLHKLSDDVQFIVITHRKGTMEAADRLYGITMQEKGVSSLISVNLEDFKEESA